MNPKKKILFCCGIQYNIADGIVNVNKNKGDVRWKTHTHSGIVLRLLMENKGERVKNEVIARECGRKKECSQPPLSKYVGDKIKELKRKLEKKLGFSREEVNSLITAEHGAYKMANKLRTGQRVKNAPEYLN